MKQFTKPLQHWINALNNAGDRAQLEFALLPNASVKRFGVFERQGLLVETFEGIDAIQAWLSRTPAGVTFDVEGPPTSVSIDSDEVLLTNYTYKVDDFTHGGYWLIFPGDDVRFKAIEHHPRALSEQQLNQAPSPETVAKIIQRHRNSLDPCEHDHSHNHDHA